MMEFGLIFTPDQRDFAANIRCAKLADELGFDYLGAIDSQFNFVDVQAFLAACALNTRRIHIGPYVSNPVTRHPSVTACAMATLSVLSGGRAELGYGRGDSAVKMLGIPPAKWSTWETSISQIRAWMAGDAVQIDGAPAPLTMPWAGDAGHVPIDVPTFGPRGCRTAARLGDWVSTHLGDIGTIEWLQQMTRKEAAELGREVRFHVSMGTYLSDDIDEARELLRYEPDELSNVFWSLVRRYPPEELPEALVSDFGHLATVEDFWAKHDWSTHAQYDASYADRISDGMVDRWTMCGTVKDCVDKLRVLENMGIDRWTASIAGVPIDEVEKQIRLIGEKVLPQFASGSDRHG